MIIINPNLRITQYYKKKIFAITIPSESYKVIDISMRIYKILKAINERQIRTRDELSKILDESMIKELCERKIIIDSNKFVYNENFLDELEVDFPLRVLTIELTNACNLNCIHCYGKFGQPSNKRMLTLEEVVALKKELVWMELKNTII